MSLRNIKIENSLGYKLRPKHVKRLSHKLMKQERNRKIRRKINASLEFVPVYRQMAGFEW